MKRRLITLALLGFFAVTGCSANERLYQKDGICYKREQARVFGLKYDDVTSVAYDSAFRPEYNTCKPE